MEVNTLITTINPGTEETVKKYQEHTEQETMDILLHVEIAFQKWKKTTFSQRAALMKSAANVLSSKKEHFATLMTKEMGKPIVEAEAEVDKCALVCDYYAEHAEQFLADESITTDAQKSYVRFEPLGTVFAIMPWNFPFWQVFRFAAPALMAGNTGVLKHASNVPGCALAIEQIFTEAGFPKNVFRTLLISAEAVNTVIAHQTIHAVTLTGSEQAGMRVAEAAGRALKKCVLELGGSDPFIILEDADLELAVAGAVRGRMINAGQSCIAAKRFLVHEKITKEFETKFTEKMKQLVIGNPLERETQVGPLAKAGFVADIDRQVQESVAQGATLLCGGKPTAVANKGFYYEPTVLTNVTPDMAVFSQETFGPVAAIVHFKTDADAIVFANMTPYGLGASVWSSNKERAEKIATQIDAGCVFVNQFVKSDVRVPFGGIKRSGYGRELSSYGIKEFVNVKTVWVQ